MKITFESDEEKKKVVRFLYKLASIAQDGKIVPHKRKESVRPELQKFKDEKIKCERNLDRLNEFKKTMGYKDF